MQFLTQLAFIILAAFLIWQLYHYVKANLGAFSKANLSRSIFTLGILTLLLIGFIAICVLIVKGYK